MVNKQKVVILGSNPMTRLSLIRSIGEALDCEIIVVDMVHSISKWRCAKTIDCYSKYVSRYLQAQKYKADPLCDLLLKEFPDNGFKTYLFSVDDDSANLIDSILDRLKNRFVCANINEEQGRLSKLMNKKIQKELASQFGFNVTKSWTIEHRGGKYAVPKGITFPCYLKGLMSYHTMKAQQGRFDSLKELEMFLEKLSSRYCYPMIVEEFLEIDKNLGVIGFCDGKECCVPCITELLESGLGSHKGVSVLGLVRKEREDEKITSQVAAFVKSLGLFGLFNVDLVVSKNKLYFIELNLRYAAYGYAVTKAGINLSGMLIKGSITNVGAKMENNSITECYYLNEKVALDDVINGYRTIKDIKQLKQKTNFGLMDNPTDRGPYRHLLMRAIFQYVKQRIKRKIKNER